MKFFSLLISVLFSACGSKAELNSIPGLERKDPQEILKLGSCIDVVDDGVEYMAYYSHESENAINDPRSAFDAVGILYPGMAGKIKCWTEYKGYYIFSFGYGDPKWDCAFLAILYVKKGEKKFRYFWPHT